MLLKTYRKSLPLQRQRAWSTRFLKPQRTLLTSSYVEGPTEPPLNTNTLSGYFEDELLPKYASRPALISRTERPGAHAGPLRSNLGREDCLAWSYEAFHKHIEALARGLISLGVKKGDRVGVVMGNNSAYACLQWACASIGAILCTINPAYRTHELIDTLRLTGVSTLILVPNIRTSTYLTSLVKVYPELRSATPGNIQVEDLPDLRHILVVDNTGSSDEFYELLYNVNCSLDFREAFVWNENSAEQKVVNDIKSSSSPHDIINLQFTSGTTGLPKAVSLTHTNLLNNGISIGRCMRLTSEDVVMFLHYSTALISTQVLRALLYSDAGVPPIRLVLGNLAAWVHGSCIVYPSEIFNPPAIVDAVLQERCTALHGVPTHFLGVLGEVEKRRANGGKLDLTRLRTGIAAGSPIPIELMRRLISELNLRDLTNAYGMTETSPVSFQTTPDDPIIKRIETVGKVQPHVKAKIIGPEGNTVPIGTPGEICVAGYLLQKGYWKDEEHTKTSMKRHPDDPDTLWMHTGDTGIMDEEGYLRIVSRIKDIIIRGGENLFPVQIENRLMAHPSVHEVAVVGVPDHRYGEVVGAFVVRSEVNGPQTREELRAWVAGGMNPQNAPTWVWFMDEESVPKELPKTLSGKVQKNILREWAKDLRERGVGQVKT